jgi:hypothetical protein
MRCRYIAVYSRGKQEKNRRKKGTTEKTKEKVCAIDVTICKGSWYQMRLDGRCVQQRDRAYIGQDIIEPPLLLREERIDEPIEHQQHLDGLLPQGDRSQPEDTEEKWNNKGQRQRTQCAIREK